MSTLVGKSIKGYLFEEALGKGSFGAVYRVSKNGVTCAAKVLSEVYILEEFKSEDNRIKREIDILKQVKGENLIQYVDDFFFDNEFGIREYVIVMEYAYGNTLHKFIQNNDDISKTEFVFLQILHGVKQLHTANIYGSGIIHRDLKPDNIMVEQNLNVKIIDYGLSKIIDYSSLTSTGAQIGSPLYMSPEQISDSKHIDYRSDLYALGVILYEMTTKTVPYKATNIPELMLKILNDPIIAPKQYNPNISDKLEKIIFKATSKKLYARYQTAEAFIEDFMAAPSDDSEYNISSKFYAWIYKEKDVTQQFEEHNKPDIIYPLHVQNWQKGLNRYFEEKNFSNIIIDPSTQRLSYFAFANVKGLTTLNYAPQKGVISLDLLLNPQKRHEYINNWYQVVKNKPNILLPYHYISNTEYPVERIEEWVKINVQLIDESAELASDDQIKYAMISIGMSHLVYRTEQILSFYIHANVDAYIVQVSDLKNLNEQSLVCYVNFMCNLQKYTGKPVIALKVPVPLGLALMAKGVHGFSLGLAGIEYFDEQYIKIERDAFNIYSKYYFPQIVSFLSYPRKDKFVFRQLYDHFGACNCRWCSGKDALEIADGDKNIQLHHWQSMLTEVEQLNALNAEQKTGYIKKRIINAIDNYNEIPQEFGNFKKNGDYKLLKNLLVLF
jgi:serine/threonine-protein kinase